MLQAQFVKLQSLLAQCNAPQSLVDRLAEITPTAINPVRVKGLATLLNRIKDTIEDIEVGEEGLKEQWIMHLTCIWAKFMPDGSRRLSLGDQVPVSSVLETELQQLLLDEPQTEHQMQEAQESEQNGVQSQQVSPSGRESPPIRSSTPIGSPGPFLPPGSSVPSTVRPPARPKEQIRNNIILKAVIPSSFQPQPAPRRNMSLEEELEKFPAHNRDRAITKTGLKSRMHDAFYELKLDSDTDLDGIAAMVRLSAIACNLKEPFRGDRRLGEELFHAAYLKMPPNLQKACDTKFYKQKGQIESFFHWIRFYLIRLYDKLRREEGAHTDLCTRCFHLDHTKEWCTNKEIYLTK